MTGIGRGKSDRVEVEIRSHNHRFLEVSVKTPTIVTGYEGEIRKRVARMISRGYVTVAIQIEDEDEGYELFVDHSLLSRIVRLRDELVRRYGIQDTLSFDTVIQLPGIVKFTKKEMTQARLSRQVMAALDQALAGLIHSKELEGKNIERSIRKSLQKIKKLLKRLKIRAPLRRREKRKRLERLLAEALIKATPKKMAEEILYYVDRLDITEECARMESHLDLIEKALVETTPGRRINFLTQELYREANTTAAKAYDAQISQLVVGIKEEVEKIREQIQNVE